MKGQEGGKFFGVRYCLPHEYRTAPAGKRYLLHGGLRDNHALRQSGYSGGQMTKEPVKNRENNTSASHPFLKAQTMTLRFPPPLACHQSCSIIQHQPPLWHEGAYYWLNHIKLADLRSMALGVGYKHETALQELCQERRRNAKMEPLRIPAWLLWG